MMRVFVRGMFFSLALVGCTSGTSPLTQKTVSPEGAAVLKE